MAEPQEREDGDGWIRQDHVVGLNSLLLSHSFIFLFLQTLLHTTIELLNYRKLKWSDFFNLILFFNFSLPQTLPPTMEVKT